MKQAAIFILSFLFLSAIQAQNGSGIEFGVGMDAGVPTGNDLKPDLTFGIGGDATLGYNFTPHHALLVRGGYMSFITKKEVREHASKAVGDGFIKFCGRYTFPKSPFYLEPQLGFTRFTSNTSGRNSISSSGFTYAGAAGLFLNKLKALDLSLRYEGTLCNNGINFVGLRLAYSIKPGTYF